MSGPKGPLPPGLWNRTPLNKFNALVRANNRYHMPKEEQFKVTLLFVIPTVFILSGFQSIGRLEEWWNRPGEQAEPAPCRKKTMFKCD